MYYNMLTTNIIMMTANIIMIITIMMLIILTVVILILMIMLILIVIILVMLINDTNSNTKHNNELSILARPHAWASLVARNAAAGTLYRCS